MNTTTTAVGAIRRIERPECTALALLEFHRIGELLGTLDEADWSRPTDCPDWDVRAVAGHILGMAQTFSSLRQFLSYMPTAARTRHGRDLTDSLTALQVERTAGLDRSTLISDIGVVGAAAARWRASRRLMRRIPLKQPMPDGTRRDLATRLPSRRHPGPGSVDAPGRHLPRRRPARGADRRS